MVGVWENAAITKSVASDNLRMATLYDRGTLMADGRSQECERGTQKCVRHATATLHYLLIFEYHN